MRRLRTLAWILVSLVLTSCGGGTGGGGNLNPPPPSTTAEYTLLTWSELGMHCMDGKDYSIFSVLPPYNTVRAQLVKSGATPQRVTSGVTLTYEAVADTSGSINTSSSGKTNFWTYAAALFLQSLALDVGLTGKPVQSLTPQPLDYNSSLRLWEAEGIPTAPYDDSGSTNAYPMAKIVAKDSTGKVLAEAKVVLAVSDEMSCRNCHASDSNPDARPASGWENNPDPLKDTKLNILKLHDNRIVISPYLPALASKGYTYTSSLYQTAQSGTPILCSACHASNALPGTGVSGVPPLTASMHSLHGGVTNPASGTTLDNATSPFGSCYLCHPGVQTQCQRGAMSSIACMSCHGNLTAVGAAARRGWLDVPSCQNCHTGGNRYQTTFDGSGQWRVTADSTFATNPDTPIAGTHLYRFSKGHGQLGCPACHGSPHAEYPTSHPNDNVYSLSLQGYAGTITPCSVCHSTVPLTQTGGPHGTHTFGQAWVERHKDYASNGGYTQCAYCHGAGYLGTFLSKTKVQQTFTIEEGTKTLPAGYMVGCYDCHNGPTGG